MLMIAAALPHIAIAESRREFSPAHLAEAERLVYAMGIVESLTIPTIKLLQLISKRPIPKERS